MPINFIPNDPRAGAAAPAMRVQPSRANRPATRSGFVFTGATPEGTLAPGTSGFLFWQCREAAIAAIEAWEASAGSHSRWQGNRSTLALRQDAGEDLNAFYDRASFSFFHRTVAGALFLSGQSTDVVAHELGHGLLDSVRPDFFSVNFLEVGAFHEGFGDCMAILTALNDLDTRKKLLAVTTTLRKKNFVESTAEDLSRGIGLLIPGHNAAEPRHAFNPFKYQLPQTLPSNGGPGALINEVHSFGMLLSGCFWELIANLFGAASSKTPATLLAAARKAGTILIAGARGSVVTPRFLQSVGRAMVLADQSLHGGVNRDHIRNAFQTHNILLGANTMIAPSMALAGQAPKGAALSTATQKDLRDRLGVRAGAKLSLEAKNVFGTRMVAATHAREVPLASVSTKLKGVVAVAHEPVMVGASGRKAAVIGAMPHAADTEAEVLAFVETLLAHDRIDFGTEKAATKKRGLMAAERPKHTTHIIKRVRGKKVLERVRFLCGQTCSHG
jgi:hypothetical protein